MFKKQPRKPGIREVKALITWLESRPIMSFNIEYDGLKIAGIFGPKEIPLDTVLPERKAQTIQEEITPEQAEELKKEYEKVQNLHRAQLMNRGERVTPIEDTLFDPIESATGQIVY